MRVIQAVNGWLFSGPILILLFGVHVYFTIYTGFVQRKLGKGICLSLRGNDKGKSGMSSFGTLTTTLAATLGTGNIIGVSTAVSLGGPGAVFWCWLTGVLGMATTYAETTLCCTYRKRESGEPVGGMMYVLKNALGKKKMAAFYSFFVCFSAYFAGCTTQSNAISETCKDIWNFPKWLVGIITALIVGLVILQGVKWIEKASMIIVPAMALLFVAGCVIYLILHIRWFPQAIRQIIKSALSPRCAAAGGLGYTVGAAVRYGVARGLFTNEAGLGTSGIAAACGDDAVSAEEQGLISMTATFWDTVVLCAITGIVVVIYQMKHALQNSGVASGLLVKDAFHELPLGGTEIIGIATVAFAVATLIGWSLFGNVAAKFLGGSQMMRRYQYIYVVMIFSGAVMPLGIVWEITDFVNLFLLLPSVYTLFCCRKILRKK
ncbi:MAG: alanine/glycine:cation symporter family protein [Eubacterium sp.]